jgi:thiamine-monophosphate kinase
VAKAARKVPAGYVGIGDDVAVVPARGAKAVLKVDMLVESTDVPRGMDYRQAARKAVAMCVSDFAAKGVRPDSFMASIGLRRGTSQGQVDLLAKGFKDAQDEWGVRMVGGDTNEAGQLIVDCVMVGFAKRIVGRSGARPGDLLVVTGHFGLPPSGLRIMAGGMKAGKRFRGAAVRSVTKPAPQLEVGLALSRHLTSSMDSSDGLSRSVHTLAEASGVGFEIDRLPAADGTVRFAEQNGLSLRGLVMAGGEEYAIVGTVRPGRLGAASKAAGAAGGRLIAIGRATRDTGKVTLKEGRSWTRVPDEGWTHLG